MQIRVEAETQIISEFYFNLQSFLHKTIKNIETTTAIMKSSF